VFHSDPIVRRKLSDEVVTRLKRLITSGELNPGDEVPSERELMKRFGVGRPAIREAMQVLASMGLVAISHGERAKVLKLTAQSILRQIDGAAKIMLSSSRDSLEHLKSARIFFERGMVREAAEKATTADTDRLKAILGRQRGLLGNADGFIDADMEFHADIASISGNPIYGAVSAAMLSWLKEYHTEMLIWTGKEKYTLAEHEKIIGRIAAHDPDGAEREIVKHLERSRALYARAQPDSFRQRDRSARASQSDRPVI
jgi:GntR family transcriptional regulator, sialic acid-inducible nan operon repressor